MPPHVGGALAPRALLRRDEPGRHVRLAVHRFGVEQVAAGLARVHEDRVVLGGPAGARLGAVVVGPDQLVEEALAAEQLVQQQLAVVRLAVVDVEVQRAVRREQAADLAQPRLEEAEVVVEGVAVRGLGEQARGVAAALEAGAVARAVRHGGERLAALLPARVEGRVQVGQRDGAGGLGAQQREVVAEQDPVHAGDPNTVIGRDRPGRAAHHDAPSGRAVRLRRRRARGRGRVGRARALRAPGARRRRGGARRVERAAARAAAGADRRARRRRPARARAPRAVDGRRVLLHAGPGALPRAAAARAPADRAVGRADAGAARRRPAERAPAGAAGFAAAGRGPRSRRAPAAGGARVGGHRAAGAPARAADRAGDGRGPAAHRGAGRRGGRRGGGRRVAPPRRHRLGQDRGLPPRRGGARWRAGRA